MSGIVKLTMLREADVCASDPRAKTEDVLAVELPDDALAGDGYDAGDFAVVNLKKSPKPGQLGAIRVRGGVAVGYLFFSLSGGVFLHGSNPDDTSPYYRKGSYEVVGAVYKVCKSCAEGKCISVPEREGVHFPVVLAN